MPNDQENIGLRKIGIFPGSFKPPHKGHFQVVEDMLLQCDHVIVLISPKSREGVTVEQSSDIWNLYKPLLGDVRIEIANENAVTETYQHIKENPNDGFLLAFGKDDEKRFKAALDKSRYPNATVFDAGNNGGLSATIFRGAIRDRDINIIDMYLPTGINSVQFMEKMKMNLHESFSTDWWKDKINEVLNPNEDLTQEFITFATKQLQLTPEDYSIEFSEVPLKDTFGHFDPNNKNILVYWGQDRAFPDKARTLAHELVHAFQAKNNIELNGETGSPCENEANAAAGIILRKFKDIHPEIFQL